MFRSTDRELRRLEEALLEEEEPQAADALLEEETLDALLSDTAPAKGQVVYQNYSNDYGRELRNYASGYDAYNSDACDVDLADFSESVRQKPENNRPLVLLACLLAAGIVVVLLILLIRYGGIL